MCGKRAHDRKILSAESKKYENNQKLCTRSEKRHNYAVGIAHYNWGGEFSALQQVAESDWYFSGDETAWALQWLYSRFWKSLSAVQHE